MKRILIIEDDKLIARIYSTKFQQEGWLVDIASDGQMGIEMVNTRKPDLVLLDLVLPKVLGINVLQHIRAQPDLRNLPVIVFSTGSHANMVEAAVKAGATRIASKIHQGPQHIVQFVKTALADAEKAAPAPAVAPAPQAAAPKSDLDRFTEADFQADLRLRCLDAASLTLTDLGRMLEQFVKRSNDTSLLQELSRKVHSLSGYAGLTGLHHSYRLGTALESLLQDLQAKPGGVTPSAITTVAQALNLLGTLFQQASGTESEKEPTLSACVLVVGDDKVARAAVRQALVRVDLTVISIDHAPTAMRLAAENRFDLVILDLARSGYNSFDVCSELRATTNCAETPIILLAAAENLENQARADLCGAKALIGKPFQHTELAVKALLFIMQGQAAA